MPENDYQGGLRMLVLSRRCDAEIYIGPDITIKVLEIHKRQVKLGIEAPSGFSVLARGTPAHHRSRRTHRRERFIEESAADVLQGRTSGTRSGSFVRPSLWPGCRLTEGSPFYPRDLDSWLFPPYAV